MKRYIKANDEYYGYDSNGEEIDESTVDALRQVVVYEVLPFTELEKLGNVSLSEDSFKYTATGTAFGAYLQYTLDLSTTDDEIDVYSFMRPDWNDLMLDFNREENYVNFRFAINVKGDNIDVVATDIDVYENGRYSEYYSKKFADAFDIDRICEAVREIAEPTVYSIKSTVSDI
jgi:hypothetical protein